MHVRSVDEMTLNFDDIEPWRSIERVNLSDDGEILARFGDSDYRDDGSNGQVMVRIPKFYYRAEHGPRTHGYYISPYRLSGYKVSRGHLRDGKEVDEIFIGAYKASCYDVSDGAYNLTDAPGIDFTPGSGDKMASIAGAKPISGFENDLTLPNARILAQNRGPGWGLVDFISVSMVNMLMLVELGHFDAQTKIGRGIVDVSVTEGNMAMPTGQTAELGNQSGQATGNVHPVTGEAANSISYRGLEDWWGNINEWTDGINIRNLVPYVADHDYVSDKFDGHYESLGFTMPNVNGYVSDIGVTDKFDWGFLPSAVGGSDSTKLCDHYYQNTGDTVAARGGSWSVGSSAGPFGWAVNYSASRRDRLRGARLLYVRGSD
jgi:hypothetical protein